MDHDRGCLALLGCVTARAIGARRLERPDARGDRLHCDRERMTRRAVGGDPLAKALFGLLRRVVNAALALVTRAAARR